MQQNRRALRAAEAIREVVGMAILAELKDPRIQDVTVTHVEVSPDLRYAKVYVSVMGNETKQKLSLRGLRNARGYLQAKCAEQIDTRFTPRLEFVLDQGVKKSIEISRILREVLPPDQSAAEEETEGEEVDQGEELAEAENLEEGTEPTSENRCENSS